MTPRQQKLVRASEAVDACKRGLEMDFPQSRLDDSMLTSAQRDLFRSKHLDIAALDLASKTVMAVAEDPDAYGLLMKLRADKPKEFAAIMVLVNIEIERKPAQAEAA